MPFGVPKPLIEPFGSKANAENPFVIGADRITGGGRARVRLTSRSGRAEVLPFGVPKPLIAPFGFKANTENLFVIGA